MTPTQVQQVLDHMDRLFPRSKLDNAERQLFGERLCRIDISVEQASAVLEEYRVNAKWATPEIGELIRLMQTAQKAARPVVAVATGRNCLIDIYRRRSDTPASVSDTDLAIWHCRNLVRENPQKEDFARDHLLEILKEFIKDEWEVWRIVLKTFPHEGIRQRELDRWRRTQVKQAERDAKKKEQAA